MVQEKPSDVAVDEFWKTKSFKIDKSMWLPAVYFDMPT